RHSRLQLRNPHVRRRELDRRSRDDHVQRWHGKLQLLDLHRLAFPLFQRERNDEHHRRHAECQCAGDHQRILRKRRHPRRHFDIQSDQILYAYGTASTFQNFSGATLKKTAGTGTTTFYPVLNNDGVLLVSSGTLTLNSGGTSNGSFSAGTGATLVFGSGTDTL